MVASLVIAALALAQASDAPATEAWLEGQLRTRLPAVEKWDIHELRPASEERRLAVEGAEVAAVGARTLVIIRGHRESGQAVTERRWYEVSGFAPAVVAIRPLGARTTLTPEMLTVASVDLMASSCKPVTDPAKAVGLRLLQQRTAGEALCASMLRPVPAVQRGGSVLVTVSVGSVALRTAAIARADAEIGERVQLFRPSDDASFSGVVRAPGEVEVR